MTMHEIKRVKSAEIFPVIQEILKQGNRAWITVTGMSMYPFLRENRDKVELVQGSMDTIRRGDIVLIRRRTGEYILHRVLRKGTEAFYMIGDAQQWVEGPLLKDQLVAVVSSVRRGKLAISCENPIWKLLTSLWLGIIPVRHLALRGISGLSRLHRILKKCLGMIASIWRNREQQKQT